MIFRKEHQLVSTKNGETGFYTGDIKSWKYDHEYSQREADKNNLQIESPSQESLEKKAQSGRDFLRRTHFDFYKKMEWDHGEECVCGKWAKSDQEVDQKENCGQQIDML